MNNKWTILAIAVLIAIGVGMGTKLVLDAQEAEAAQEASALAERAAFMAGINACTEGDIEFFQDRADEYRAKAQDAETAAAYVAYTVLADAMTTYAREWEYSKESLDEMWREYKGYGVDYQ